MFTQLFVAIAEGNFKQIHKTASNEEEFVKFVSKNERKSTYHIQINQIKSDAERASFMEGLFASSKLVVVSRPDENGTLKVTALNQFTPEQVVQEVEAILVSSKSKPSKNVLKNK
jgi:hypothetical protein